MKDKLSPYKHLVVTHADFDGIASLVNVYNIVENPDKNFQYYAVGYNYMEKALTRLQKDTFDILWILDLNLTREDVAHLKALNCKKIIWIDHHTYEYDVKAYLKEIQLDCVFIHDDTKSACLATNDFIAHNWPTAAAKLRDFCVVGDIYDCWRTDNPRFNEAYAINDLYWEYKHEKFFATFKNGYKLKAEDKETITSIHTARVAYEKDTIENHLQLNEEFGIGYFLNPKCEHVNHITLTFKCKIYVILKEVTDKNVGYSIRLYDPDFDLTLQEVFAIIKKVGIKVNTSGGYAKVGGINIPIEENEKFLTAINLIFERKMKE